MSGCHYVCLLARRFVFKRHGYLSYPVGWVSCYLFIFFIASDIRFLIYPYVPT